MTRCTVLLLTLLAHLTSLATASSPFVTNGAITYDGIVSTADGSQEAFLGIPYGVPPVANLRFKPTQPLPVPSIPTTINATAYGNKCMQIRSVFGDPIPGPISEDCLSLNIFRPAGINSSAKLPVMLWIYGGGFFSGYTKGYDPSQLIAQSMLGSSQPVIYVSINYRTGIWGFLTGKEAAANGAVNAGLYDQRLAMQWVHDNIAAFGGDPSQVTIFGESAGSISVGWHLLRPTDGLFRAAIMESGSPGSFPAVPSAARQATYNAAISYANCDQTADTFLCMQQAPLDLLSYAFGSIQNATNTYMGAGGFAFGPVLDGWISDIPTNVIASGNWAKVPFIDGNNLDEGTIFATFSKGNWSTTDDIVQYLLKVAPLGNEKIIRQFVEMYPENPAAGSPFGTGDNNFGMTPGFKRLAALYGDFVFAAHRRTLLQLATSQNIPSWAYLFTENTIPLNSKFSWLGVNHGAELAFVYNDGDYTLPDSATSPQLALSSLMMEYWLNFARHANPNPVRSAKRALVDLTYWDPYTFDGNLMNFTSAGSHVMPDAYRLNSIGFVQEHPGLF